MLFGKKISASKNIQTTMHFGYCDEPLRPLLNLTKAAKILPIEQTVLQMSIYWYIIIFGNLEGTNIMLRTRV
jgi:hypothetical protein